MSIFVSRLKVITPAHLSKGYNPVVYPSQPRTHAMNVPYQNISFFSSLVDALNFVCLLAIDVFTSVMYRSLRDRSLSTVLPPYHTHDVGILRKYLFCCPMRRSWTAPLRTRVAQKYHPGLHYALSALPGEGRRYTHIAFAFRCALASETNQHRRRRRGAFVVRR